MRSEPLGALRRRAGFRWQPGTTCAVALFATLETGGLTGGSVAPVATEAVPPASAAVTQATWPATPEGEIARGWVEAFDAGEPAMRKFLTENLTAASLARKDLDARMETVRSMRDRVGPLKLVRVDEERDGALDVALAGEDGTEHDFTFELEPATDPAAPRKLAGVTARLRVEHSMFGH